MQARMATYKLNADGGELARKAEEGILPLLQSQQGFKAYSAGELELISVRFAELMFSTTLGVSTAAGSPA